MRIDILERKEEILNYIALSKSKAEISSILNCKPSTLNIYLVKMGIEYKGNLGKTGKLANNRKTFYELSQSKSITSHKLRLRLLEEGIKLYRCECCGLTEWMGNPIPLELHHINGIHSDNNITNLLLLCPNCHALTENYSCKKGIEHQVESREDSLTETPE